MTNNESLTNRRLFWLWILVTTTGSAIASGIVDTHQRNLAVPGMLMGGAIIVVGQWQVLRNVLPSASWWIVATLVGALLGFVGVITIGAIFFVAGHLGPASLATLPATLFVGGEVVVIGAGSAILGVCQGLVLRPFLHSIGRWVLATTVAGIASTFANLGANVVADVLLGGHPYVVQGIVVGLVVGALTGAILVRYQHLPRRARARERRKSRAPNVQALITPRERADKN